MWKILNKIIIVYSFYLPLLENGLPTFSFNLNKCVNTLALGAGLLISLNSSMSITVILAPFRGPLGARVNSEPPEKSMDRQIITNF